MKIVSVTGHRKRSQVIHKNKHFFYSFEQYNQSKQSRLLVPRKLLLRHFAKKH